MTLAMSDIVSSVVFDRTERKVHRVREQDVEPILDSNKRLAQERQRFAGTFRHVGTVPCVIIERWINEGAPVLGMSKDEFDRFIRKKLNDPEWAYLRTAPGRV